MERFVLNVERDCLSVDTKNRCNVPNDNIIRAAEASFLSHRVAIQTTQTRMPILYVVPRILTQTPSKSALDRSSNNATTISNLLRGSEEFEIRQRRTGTRTQPRSTERRNFSLEGDGDGQAPVSVLDSVFRDDEDDEEGEDGMRESADMSEDGDVDQMNLDNAMDEDEVVTEGLMSTNRLLRRAQELGINMDLFNSFPDNVSRFT